MGGHPPRRGPRSRRSGDSRRRLRDQRNLPVLLPPPNLSSKVKSSVQDQGRHHILPTPAGRSPLPEQTKSPTPALVKAMSMQEILVRSMPYKQVISVKAPPETPDMIPIVDRVWKYTPCVDRISRESLRISMRIVKLLRHSQSSLQGVDAKCQKVSKPPIGPLTIGKYFCRAGRNTVR